MPNDNVDLSQETDQVSEEQDEKLDDSWLKGDEDTTEEKPEEEETTEDGDYGDDPDNVTDEEVDFPDWAKQYELPEDITSVDDLATKFAEMQKQTKPESGEMSAEMIRIDAMLKAKGLGGVEALLKGDVQQPQQPAQQQDSGNDSFFTRNPLSTHINSLVESGEISAEHAPGWKSNAKVFDSVLNPILDRMQDALSGIAQVVESNRSGLSNFQWAEVKGRLKDTEVTKDKLDSFMRQHNIPDYNSGILAYAAIKDPGLLPKIQRNAEEKGTNKALKKLRRTTGMPKNKGNISGSAGFDVKRFTLADGSLNEAAVDALNNPAKALKIIEAHEKWASKRQ